MPNANGAKEVVTRGASFTIGWRDNNNASLFSKSGITTAKISRLAPLINKKLQEIGSPRDSVLSLREISKARYEGVARVANEWREFQLICRGGTVIQLLISDKITNSVFVSNSGG